MTIPETTSTLGFSCDVHFQRTGKIRERVVDCSREELIDYAFMLLDTLEKTHGMLENHVDKLEEMLGYNELMTPR
jgi:hypothetical protein